ncbi:MAG: UDP-N-acetylglucosamine 1-carboxyvinyltransferase [Elusimicrobia bacterium HGW-Elusimicrobia-1]|jgi:UDP-N-acetylglucosamine 1-carboxyvinyltransferase|nr:MAG: UDP-N-acetylglucosamine 1-carboxyvinyltransferase [Elusimicrobia bacterium HGW-Elusimicrobia-1]
MDSILINGGKKLKGKVAVSGSKNAALPELFASILTDDKIILENLPRLNDTLDSVSLLERFGKRVKWDKRSCAITPGDLTGGEIPYDLVRRMRASILMAGPVLARYKKVRISLPGGCAIGARPVDIHLEGFKKMGAAVDLKGGYVEMSARRLRGARIRLRYPSVGATENLVMAATLADGITVLENAAREPEIGDLCAMLSSMGADISGAASGRIKIRGVRRLGGVRHRVIPDRIEAATYLAAAAITGGDVTAQGADPSHLAAFLKKLSAAGVKISTGADFIRAAAGKRHLKPVDVKTAVYPGFPTDLQAQWMALMSAARGSSRISETVFENRFLHVAELSRLGAALNIAGNTVRITGVEGLSGAPVMASDLRAGAALVLAGLAAKGLTRILRVYHLDRGYENLVGKLRLLGARVKRVHA